MSDPALGAACTGCLSAHRGTEAADAGHPRPRVAMALPSADAAMAGVAAANGPAASGVAAAGSVEVELDRLRQEIEQHKVATNLMVDTRGSR